MRKGIARDDAWKLALAPANQIIAFTEDHARTTGSLVAQTRPLGLSLGDRACLAMALELKPSVYTADKSWKKLNLGIAIHVIW